MKLLRSCEEIHLVLTVFGIGRHTDLPDDVAFHIEECPACTTRFDQQYPPLQLISSDVHAPMHPPSRRQRGAVAFAALGLLALGISPPQMETDPLAMWFPGESALTIDEMLAADPECPQLLSETDPPVCPEDDGEWM